MEFNSPSTCVALQWEMLARRFLDVGMLRINIETANGTATLHCSGRVVFGMEVETLRTMARARPECSITIDLEAVEAVDASGLGLLVELQDWARRGGRTVRFRNASDSVGRLIALTRLNEVLSIPIVSLPQSRAGCTFATAALSA